MHTLLLRRLRENELDDLALQRGQVSIFVIHWWTPSLRAAVVLRDVQAAIVDLRPIRRQLTRLGGLKTEEMDKASFQGRKGGSACDAPVRNGGPS